MLGINYEIKSIEKEFEGNKLYIINNLKISEDILLDTIKSYINTRKNVLVKVLRKNTSNI